MAKKIEIFKPGKFTALNGKSYEFGEDDLRGIAAAYDPAVYEAPLVVGHPKVNAPAYGWTKTLSFADGVLVADPDQVDPEFAELVNAGRYKRISASLFAPDSPGNPKPGGWYLRHIGFLGAHAPAVKGLKDASFGESTEGVVCFGDWNDRLIARMFRNIKNFLIGQVGQEKADQVLDEWDLQSITEEAVRPEMKAEPAPCYGEPPHKEEPMKLTPEQIAAKEAEFTEREANLAKKEAAVRHDANLAFAEGLVKEGRLLPAQKERAVAILDFAAGTSATDVIEFGAGDAKVSASLADTFREFLKGQPKAIEFGELAPDEAEEKTAEFAAAPGYTVDAASLETHNKALAYQAKNPGVDYMTAIKAVS